jgi:H+-transporting ATPase
MGLSELVFCIAALAYSKYRLALGIDALRTVAFLAIVCGNQATTYINRERQHFGTARPSPWVVASSIADLFIASTLAIWGIAMAPVHAPVVAGIILGAAAFGLLLDIAKVPVFQRLSIQ